MSDTIPFIIDESDKPPYCYYKYTKIQDYMDEDMLLFFNTAVNNNTQTCTNERKCVCKNGILVQEEEAGKIHRHYPWTSGNRSHNLALFTTTSITVVRQCSGSPGRKDFLPGWLGWPVLISCTHKLSLKFKFLKSRTSKRPPLVEATSFRCIKWVL